VLLTQYFSLQEQIGLDRQRTRLAVDSYAKVEAGFPQLPTTTDNLRVTMQNYAALTKQTARPERLIGDLSAALDASPRIEVDKLQWELTANPRAARADRPQGSSPAAPVRAAPDKAAAGPLFEVVQIDGKVTAVKASDYKAITALVNEFIERLGKRPGVEVIQTKMPFELGSTGRLSGDIGNETGAAVPRFSLTVTKKTGS
jgi:hypothetical protein